MIGENISHYRIVEKTGGGGMGVVYQAEETRLGRGVALKFLPDGLSETPAAMERFLREARAASALNHPNICTLHDIGEPEGWRFIVMELLERQRLAERIAGTPVDLEALLVSYLWPEQARSEEVDGRTDFLSLSVVLYELATGARAVDGSSMAVSVAGGPGGAARRPRPHRPPASGSATASSGQDQKRGVRAHGDGHGRPGTRIPARASGAGIGRPLGASHNPSGRRFARIRGRRENDQPGVEHGTCAESPH